MLLISKAMKQLAENSIPCEIEEHFNDARNYHAIGNIEGEWDTTEVKPVALPSLHIEVKGDFRREVDGTWTAAAIVDGWLTRIQVDLLHAGRLV